MDEQAPDSQLSDLSNNGTLADSPPPYASLLYWQIELHQLLTGNRTAGIIHAMGSASDYVKTLFPRPSANKDVARYFCVEALNGILLEESLVSLSWSALNYLLDLILEFKPRNGFPALVTYLKLGAIAEPEFVPIGGAVTLDLHQKTLATLGAYYDAPSIDKSEPAFLTYVEVLNQQLHSGYQGYAAFELLKLEVLQPDSTEFKLFIKQHPESLNEILLNLSHYASAGYGLKDIKTLFYVCLESEEVFKKLLDAIKAVGGSLEQTVQAHPREAQRKLSTPTLVLRLLGAEGVSINLGEEQVELINRYSHEKDMQRDVVRLLSDTSLTLAQKQDEATQLLIKSCMLDIRGLELFVEELENSEAVLRHDRVNNRIYIEYAAGEIDLNLEYVSGTQLEIYFRYFNETEDIPSDPRAIDATLREQEAQAEMAFASKA